MVRFVDITVAAQAILKVCVPQSKFGFAGYAVIGDRGSLVTVNGVEPEINGVGSSEDGNGTNATSMATGTAVENPFERVGAGESAG